MTRIVKRGTRALLRIVLAAFVIAGLGPWQPIGAQDPPRRVILLIGDGAGISYWSAALLAAESLAVQAFPVVGLVDTRASDSKVTDSAASATAYATGVRTYNGAIGVAPDTTELETVLEMAQKRSMATGLIATSRITHATPASFAAHVPSRLMEWEIGRQILEHDVTVVMGGGWAIYDPAERPDSLDLLTQIRERYTYIETPHELAALEVDTVRCLFGMFAPSHMPGAVRPEVTLRDTVIQITSDSVTVDSSTTVADTTWVPYRSPTLPEMTFAALEVLDKDADGFFLMVEGSQPDWRGHGNQPLATIEAEMLDLDRAVGVALEYRERRPETLIVVLADHETGGLALQYDSIGTFREAYTTLSHTAEMIPLFAIGPGAERFGGIVRNDRIGQLLIEAVRGTERSRAR